MSPTDAPKGRIFDIQHCSLDDGPGIRTAVFLKGCNLRCRWCHNPESISPGPMLAYRNNLCRKCLLCGQACQFGVHGFPENDGAIDHNLNYANCTLCGKCVEVCQFDALEIIGRLYSSDDLYQELKIDMPYYSIGEGGGVTFSGGEPLLQIDFLEGFMKAHREIHTCVETAANVPEEFFSRLLPLVDLFLFDYKATDSAKHKELCGDGNDRILKNLDYLYQNSASIILRIPLIPGINDDDDHLKGIAALLDKYPRIPYGQIMPYHNLGTGKREIYDINFDLLDLPTAEDEQKKIWLKRLKAFGAERIRLT